MNTNLNFKRFVLQITLGASALSLVACGGDIEPAGLKENANYTSASSIYTEAFQQSAAVSDPHVAYINATRQRIGIGALSWSSALEKAAFDQSTWIDLNSVSHEQIKDTPGFTGEYLYDRLNRVGLRDTTFSGETIAVTQRTAEGVLDATRTLLQSPAHRVYLLAPEFHLIGSAIKNTALVSVLAQTNQRMPSSTPTVFYPYDGQTDAMPLYDSRWSKLKTVSFNGTSGTPISITRGLFSTISLNEFSLFETSTMQRVEMMDFETGINKAAIVVFPKEPLKANTNYTYIVGARVDGVSVNKSITFKTL